MQKTTPCIRCGKSRIVAKTWNEEVSGSQITYTLTVCPDPQCQRIVDSELQKKIDKVKNIQQKSLQRRILNKRNKKKT